MAIYFIWHCWPKLTSSYKVLFCPNFDRGVCWFSWVNIVSDSSSHSINASRYFMCILCAERAWKSTKHLNLNSYKKSITRHYLPFGTSWRLLAIVDIYYLIASHHIVGSRPDQSQDMLPRSCQKKLHIPQTSDRMFRCFVLVYVNFFSDGLIFEISFLFSDVWSSSDLLVPISIFWELPPKWSFKKYLACLERGR